MPVRSPIRRGGGGRCRARSRETADNQLLSRARVPITPAAAAATAERAVCSCSPGLDLNSINFLVCIYVPPHTQYPLPPPDPPVLASSSSNNNNDNVTCNETYNKIIKLVPVLTRSARARASVSPFVSDTYAVCRFFPTTGENRNYGRGTVYTMVFTAPYRSIGPKIG